MNYQRVIPRDLFNEAKLLKCLGQLALLSHDGKLPITFEHEEPECGFVIEQSKDDGALYCSNLTFFTRELHEVFVSSRYNSKSAYPLEFANSPNCTGDVFDERGEPTRDFIAFLEGI